MSPVTHFLVGWELACRCGLKGRDRTLVTIASVMPDLDGLGLGVDTFALWLGERPPMLYQSYHHFVLHGVLGLALLLVVVARCGVERLKVLGLAALAFHLHLLMDLVGSRGPEMGAIWPIYYLGPFSRDFPLEWHRQWALNAWPNIVLSVVLLGLTLRRAIVSGESPASIFGRRVDNAFVATVRGWTRRWR